MHPADFSISSINIATRYSSSTTNTLTPLSAAVMAGPLILPVLGGPESQILRVRRDCNPTVEASVNRFQLCLTLQFETNTALDKFRAKARRTKAINLWSTFLLPIDLELRRPVARDHPGHGDPTPSN